MLLPQAKHKEDFRQMSRHLLESKASAQVPWRDQRHDHECPCFLFLSLSFYCWAQWHVVWNIPLVSLGQRSWLCPLSTSCPPLGEEARAPQCCAGAVQQQPKHRCVINTVLGTNPKHSTIQAAMRKVNSIPAWPSLVWWQPFLMVSEIMLKKNQSFLLKRTVFKCPARPDAKNSCITYKQLVFSCSVACHNSMRCNTRNFSKTLLVYESVQMSSRLHGCMPPLGIGLGELPHTLLVLLLK